MKKHFIPMLVLFAFMMTLQSENMFAEYSYIDNEDHEIETRWYWGTKVWSVIQYAKDDDKPHHLDTSVYNRTSQVSLRHTMYASAKFVSRYEHWKVKGDYHLKAEIKAEWANDEEPFEKKGKIFGSKEHMRRQGSQSDTDWFAERNPLDTIQLIDSSSICWVWLPFRKVWYRASSKAYFTPSADNIRYVELEP